MTFDPVQICRVLNEEGVAYVVIGGMAAVIHGSPLPTRDLDVLPARSGDNLGRLGRALNRMDAMIRTGSDPVPVVLDEQFLMAISTILNLVTAHGDVDLVLEPAGDVGGFDGWLAHARDEEIAEGVRVFVASLDDVIASKRAANRLKDQRDLPYLESLRDEIG